MAQVKHGRNVTQELAATNRRNFRTFLLVAQLEGKAIGARIAQARDEAGMTQEQVADVATFSRRSLQDYEAGVTIPYKHMREIAAILGKPVEWLLHGDVEAIDEDRLADLHAQVQELRAENREVLRLLRELRESPPPRDPGTPRQP
jgi:transcriptional regulator with XRE-family HTH domain